MPLGQCSPADQAFPWHESTRSRPRGERGTGAARLRHRQAEGDPLAERECPGQVDGHDVLRPDVAGELGDRVRDAVPDDRDAGAVILELVAEFGRRVQRVVLDDDCAEPHHRVEGDDMLRAVRQHDGDAVAGDHTEPSKPLCGARDLRAQLTVAGLGAEELQRGSASEAVHGVVDHVDEGLRGLVDLVRHALGVVRQPGPPLVRIHRSSPHRGADDLAGR